LQTNLLYQLYTNQPLAIPNTSTFHYNKNTPKHTQSSQNPAAPISFGATFTNYPNFYN
jgi:hypothetical protein